MEVGFACKDPPVLERLYGPSNKRSTETVQSMQTCGTASRIELGRSESERRSKRSASDAASVRDCTE